LASSIWLGVLTLIVVVGLNQNSTLNGAAEAGGAAAGDADQVVDAVEAEGLADEAGGVAGAVLGKAVVGGGAVERVAVAGPPAYEAGGRRDADGGRR
jgi:hypothetical protein